MSSIETLDTFFGRNVSYSKKKIEIYDRLREESQSPFRDSTMADIFVYAAVFGFTNQSRKKIQDKVPQISAVAFTTKQKSLLLTIAIVETNNIDALFHKEESISIIEEYANGGISLIEDHVINNNESDPTEWMASEMRRLAKEWEYKQSRTKDN